jgi:hypothetical protein
MADQEDLGVLLTKIALDVADLKKGLSEGRSEMQGFKSMAQGVAQSVKNAFMFAGVTLGIYELIGALRDFAKEAAMTGARTETLEIAMNQVGKTYGMTAASLKYYVDEVKGAGITTQEAMLAITKFLASGLPLDKLKELATRARDIGVVAGVNTSEALGRMVQGIITGEQETLRRMMIQVGHTDDIYKNYAATLGTTADQLNSIQKAQAMLNEVMRLSAGYAGVAAEADASVGKQMASMTRFAEEAKNSLWSLFGPVMLEIIQQMTKGWKELKTWADANKESLSAWGQSIAEFIQKKIELIAIVGKFIIQNRELILLVLQFALFYKVAGWIIAFATALKTASVTMVAATTTAKGLQTALLGLVQNPWVIAIAVVLTGLAALKKLQEKHPETAPLALAGEAWGVMTPEQQGELLASGEGLKKPAAPAPKPEIKPATPEEAARLAQAAIEKAIRDAPKPTGKEGKGSGAGQEEDLFGEYLKVREQIRQAKIQDYQDDLDLLKAADEKKKAEMDKDLAEGLIDGQSYYQRLQELQQAETTKALALIDEKRRAQAQAYQDALADIARQDISPEMAEYKRQEEAAKNRLLNAQLDAEAAKVRLDGEKKVTEELKRQVEVAKQYKQQREDLDVETAQLLGAISSQEATLQKLYLEWQRKKQEAFAAGGYTPEFAQSLEANYQAKRADTLYGGYATQISQGISSLIDTLSQGGQDLMKAANGIFKNLFAEALKPGLDQLKTMLVKGFKDLFGEAGAGLASAVMGAIGLIGMLLTSGGGGSSFSSSGVQGGVTSSEAVRGIIAGPTSIPIAQIDTGLQEALVPTNGILSEGFNEVVAAIRGGGGGLSVSINAAGLAGTVRDAIKEVMDEYFADVLIQGVT